MRDPGPFRLPTEARRVEFGGVVEAARRWCALERDVSALAIAGSWARRAATMSSDVDLVVLTDDVQRYVQDDHWVEAACGQAARIIRSQVWGPLMERRVQLASGFVVEFGFAPLSWASVAPPDPGTARVVGDGFEILYDPQGMLDMLVRTVTERAETAGGDGP
jgi:hypothetical protein